MRIAILSGKGGTGKTFVAVNLAVTAKKAAYVDCDVEEPNGRLFLKPTGVTTSPVSTPLPSFHAARCTGCRKCIRFCRFNALIFIKNKPMVFPGICHACGGCQMVCPAGAITEKSRPVGHVEQGRHGDMHVITGVLNPGEASGVPVIQAARKTAAALHAALELLDCPPGSACTVMESISTADFCLLVAEPTAFGFHNFKMVHELASLLGKPCGVVINKQEMACMPLEQFCKSHALPILARIPYNAEIARLTADGKIAAKHDRQTAALFHDLLGKIAGAAS